MVSYEMVSLREGPSIPESQTSDKTHATRRSKISNHRFQIAVNWFIITIPISALTAVLLGLVFHYQVGHGDTPFGNLRGNLTQDETGVYYINMNSSVILFVASWASSLAPMLSGFILTLASFPIARQLFEDVRRGRINRLLTPYQLALTLKFLDGSALAGIWSWMVYLVMWKKRRAPQAPALIAACAVAVIAIFLGLLVALADSWLHLTTTTVPFTQLSRSSDPMIYSLGLTPNCLTSNNSADAQSDAADFVSDRFCSIIVAVTGAFLPNPTVSLEVLNNASNLTTVYTHYSENNPTPYTYLGLPDNPSFANRDYTVKTFGATTKCELISSRCNLRSVAAFDRYDCPAFNGLLGSELWAEGYFTDDTMTNNITRYGSTTNPYYHAVAGVVNQSGGGVPNSTEFVNMLHGGDAFILGCSTTIHDIEYDRVNQTISRFIATPSNISTSNIWYSANAYTMDGRYAVQQAVAAATFSETAQEFADKTALAFGKVSLAIGAGSLEKRPALAIQARDTTLVARVPAAPLITLVVVNLLYVVCGFAFAAVALISARHEVPEIQARLNIAGLVADRFENRGVEVNSAEELFEEYARIDSKRVGIERASEGGYEYQLRRRGGGETSTSTLREDS